MVEGETSHLHTFQAKEGGDGWRRNIPPLSHISSKGGRGWLEEKHPPSVSHFKQRRERVVGGETSPLRLAFRAKEGGGGWRIGDG
jgi:hypothetical protein